MKKFFVDEQGGSIVEFAFLAPVFIVISFGTFELNRYLMVIKNVDEISSQVANWTSVKTTRKAIEDYFVGAWNLGKRYDFSTYGSIFVTGIERTAGQNQPVWTVSTSGAESEFGAGGGATIPENLLINDGDQIIIVEVNYQYKPQFQFLQDIFEERSIRRVQYVLPRGLETFNPLSQS
jgi:hypothetical protein